jgi:hypothetical protein
MGRSDLLSIAEVQRLVKDLALRLGVSDFTIRTEPLGDASPYIEVGDAYHYVIDERGTELQRKTTTNLDELLYWILKGLISTMARDYETCHRRAGEDSRRQAFAKELELIGTLSATWADRLKKNQDEILGRHPFDDS